MIALLWACPVRSFDFSTIMTTMSLTVRRYTSSGARSVQSELLLSAYEPGTDAGRTTSTILKARSPLQLLFYTRSHSRDGSKQPNPVVKCWRAYNSRPSLVQQERGVFSFSKLEFHAIWSRSKHNSRVIISRSLASRQKKSDGWSGHRCPYFLEKPMS